MSILNMGKAAAEKIAVGAALDKPYHGPFHPDGVVEVDADVLAQTFGDPVLYTTTGCAPAATEKDVKVAIADEAKNIVAGARRAAYGKPEQNFERIAKFWTAYFDNRGISLIDEKDGLPVKITAADVSPMMRLMKEARLCETPDHRDSFVDLVGYTLTGAEVNGVKP